MRIWTQVFHLNTQNMRQFASQRVWNMYDHDLARINDIHKNRGLDVHTVTISGQKEFWLPSRQEGGREPSSKKKRGRDTHANNSLRNLRFKTHNTSQVQNCQLLKSSTRTGVSNFSRFSSVQTWGQLQCKCTWAYRLLLYSFPLKLHWKYGAHKLN